ncbi:MAG: hypothetical protein NZ888_06350 [Candidatus Nitrosocaldus sp.]|nr:hypothetical protein [Candidatus Nitrosocaldus sp.]MCS7141788.1 hypothetical protein [Candidatus Nitrosocaldus sp.]MDW8000464.1 hypothetical protein [Candidatus Nitrosocaldus sp.]
MTDDNEPWQAQVIAIKALSKPDKQAVLNLTELGENEIKLLTTLSVLGKSLEMDIIEDFVVTYCSLKRSKLRKGEKSVIHALRSSTARFMQNVQLSRFKRLYSNVQEDEYE